MKIEGLPVIDVDENEEITVAVRADDLLEGVQRGRGYVAKGPPHRGAATPPPTVLAGAEKLVTSTF